MQYNWISRGLAITALVLPSLFAATLEKLSMDDLVVGSTRIVRAKVSGASAVARGSVIYTQYSISVLETLKGDAQGQLAVSVPGGQLGKVRQFFAGAPTLQNGGEYVLFLWAGKNGVNQIMGLSQGLFSVQTSGGQAMASRVAADATMLDRKTGKPILDMPLSLKLGDLRQEVTRRVGVRQ